MSLRRQLGLISLIVLVLPLAGWQFARQVEQTLREGYAQGLIDSARALAPAIAAELSAAWPTLDDGSDVVYVHRTEQAPFIDGYADEWTGWLETATERISGDGELRVRLAAVEHSSGLYLLVHATSPDQNFSRPGGPRGDHVRLRFADGDRRANGQSAGQSDGQSTGQSNRQSELTLAPLAPGWLEARGNTAAGWPRVQGVWQPRGDGWTLEVQIPDARRPSQVGVEVHDVVAGRAETRTIDYGPGLLVGKSRAIDQRLAVIAPPGITAWAVLRAGWVVGRTGAAESIEAETLPRPARATWLDTLLFERLLSGRLSEGQARGRDTTRLQGPTIGQPSTASQWSTQGNNPGIVLTASAPLLIDGRQVGSLVLSRNADDLLIQSNRAALRLVGTSLAVMLLLTLILLGFATLLSERIRRMRNQTEAAVDQDGRVRQPLSPPRAQDEIGDLGRSISTLLRRLKAHQSYLRTLADKLSHELRTPLAMIRSSLDNLEQARSPEEIERYCRRANEGSERLNRILQAMSQAARIEESLRLDQLERFELVDLLENYITACAETYPNRRFRLLKRVRQANLDGSPELFAQLLDKLIDNAVDFSPPDSRIDIRVNRTEDGVAVEIDNEGPALPDSVADQLFDSMVSVRPKSSDQVHLGLGLYIARLIVEHHQGRISASSTPRGCRIRMIFPSSQPS